MCVLCSGTSTIKPDLNHGNRPLTALYYQIPAKHNDTLCYTQPFFMYRFKEFYIYKNDAQQSHSKLLLLVS